MRSALQADLAWSSLRLAARRCGALMRMEH